MKTISSSKIQYLTLAAVLSIGLCPVSFASANYLILDLNGKVIIDLGTLGGNYSQANAINNAGQVVGSDKTYTTTPTYRQAFITDSHGLGVVSHHVVHFKSEA